MKTYRASFDLLTDDCVTILPDGEYVPAEVAERLYEALSRLISCSDDDSGDAMLLDAIIAGQSALKFADGETPTT